MREDGDVPQNEPEQSAFDVVKKAAREGVTEIGVTKAMGFDPSPGSSSIFNQLCGFCSSDIPDV